MYTLLTGTSRGLGLATAHALRELGRPLIVTARAKPAAEALARELGHDTLGFALDVAEPAHHAALAQALRGRGVAVSCLLHNAAIYERTSSATAAARTMATNVLGPLHLTRTLLPLLTDSARIVLVSSGMGALTSAYSDAIRQRLSTARSSLEVEVLVSEYLAASSSGTDATTSADATERAGFGRDPYSVSKALVNALALGWSNEFPQRTTVAVSPGWVKTDMGGSGAPGTVAQGVARIVAAVTGQVRSGAFYESAPS
jgi:carbonyl reductase 1